MSMFGWSLPPGCGSTPGEDDDYCAVCYRHENDCVCDECKICGDFGNPDCYNEKSRFYHGMGLTDEQKRSRAEVEQTDFID